MPSEPAARRNAVLGANVAALSLGAALVPILGGVLAAVAWNAPFLAYGLVLPVALFALWGLDDSSTRRRETTSEGQGTTNRGWFSYLQGVMLVLTPAMGGLLATAFLTEFLLFGALITVLPFLLTAAYGLTPLYIGLIITASEAGAVLAASVSGRLARTLTNGQLVGFGFVSYGIALGGVYLAPSPAFVALAVLVFGLGFGISMPAVDAAVSDLVSRDYRAGLLGLRNSTAFLGRATGPVVFAAAATVAGYRPLMAIAAVGVLTIAITVIVLTRSPVAISELEPTA